MYVYCDFSLLASEEKCFGPPNFFELATPLAHRRFELAVSLHSGCIRTRTVRQAVEMMKYSTWKESLIRK